MKILMVGGPMDNELFELSTDFNMEWVRYGEPHVPGHLYTLRRYGSEQFLFHSSVNPAIPEDELDALIMRSWRARNTDWAETNAHTVYGSGGKRELQELLDDGWVWIDALKDGD